MKVITNCYTAKSIPELFMLSIKLIPDTVKYMLKTKRM